AYYILDEMFIGGFQVESSKKEVLRISTAQEDYMDESKEEGFLFHATAGRSLEEQLRVAAQLQSDGASVLQKIDAMRKTTKKQKQATKANSLKFDWLQEHRHLKKLEESLAKELESLLLRMYNDACAEDALSGAKKPKAKSALGPELPSLSSAEADDKEDNNNSLPSDETAASPQLTSSPPSLAGELEELIKLEQARRVALLTQIASEREQQLAMKQLLGAIKETQRTSGDSDNQAARDEDLKTHAQQLIFDAVIGHQMVEAIIEDEAARCDRDFSDAYSCVLASIRATRGPRWRGSLTCDNQELQEQRVREEVDALGGSECSDEMLRLEITDELRALYLDLQADLEHFRRAFQAAASAPDATGNDAAAGSKTGGWADVDDERFLKVLKSYERKGGSAKKPELLYHQLQHVLPHVSVTELKAHAKFHHHLRFYQDKCRDRQAEFERRHTEARAMAQEKLQAALRAEREKQAQLEQLQALQRNCTQLHERVAGWKVAKEAQDRIAQQQQEIEQLEAAQKQEEDELQSRKRHEKQKRLVEDYRKSKLLEGIAGEKQSDDELVQREAELVAQSLVNAERVQFRHDEYQRKLEDERLEQLRKARAEELRIAKLNALKDETPYAQIIASIVPDPERTRQETVAYRANVEAAQENLPVHEAGLFPTHGYDCDTLFRNARFKLGLALRNAGLHTNEYARQALANVKVSNAGAYRHHVAQSTQLW
ncbi:hypothetical protein PybrP1_004142, partial [[Pythium] brassicae (nom. inval.)]